MTPTGVALGWMSFRMGKPAQAIEYYALAASVPGAEPGGRAHLEALTGKANVDSALEKTHDRPQSLRSYAVPGSKVEEVG